MRRFDLSPSSSSFLVGRDPAVTNLGNNLTPVKLNSGRVSRSHLLLKLEGGEWWAQDLGSTNTTIYQGEGKLLAGEPTVLPSDRPCRFLVGGFLVVLHQPRGKAYVEVHDPHDAGLEDAGAATTRMESLSNPLKKLARKASKLMGK
ncbi:MAG: FHA domain-containing protein [Holophagaceae bacterium]|nr:FHA domain-containing protein [Holophagaceae bacterium]